MNIRNPREDSKHIVYLMLYGKTPQVRQLAWLRWIELLEDVRSYDLELFNELSMGAVEQALRLLPQRDDHNEDEWILHLDDPTGSVD